ncbi:MAG: hypothetical protein JO053_16415, partial [Acidobacteria bacterium]|nr:hypothetical protein [Acidobacteriota bacterium]
MRKTITIRFIATLLVLASMVTPMFALGGGTDARKHYNQGLKFEISEEWDKAAEEFALAVTEAPKNPEYHLHLTRALFNASQMFMKRGNLAAKENDYAGAYVAFRRAYAFDPTNELAKSEMERMVRLQKGVNDVSTPGTAKPAAADIKNVSFPGGQVPQMPPRLEKLRELPFAAGVDLQFIIKELAKDLDLNVLFDSETFRTPGRKTYIELHNVTAARALDYIFLQEGLFFQKVGPHTILIANQAQRTKFQQLVLRTFYLANAAPKDVAKVVQTAIPAQPGRSQTIVLTDDATNSITIRDTEENIRLIGQLIGSLDKDRAEVVMDVAIYEVNKSDLLQLGNQLGTAGQNGTLLNIGGATLPTLQEGATAAGVLGHLGFTPAGALGLAIGLPTSQIAALQTKSDTKLIASTQIHAFNNEDSSARIGQRVPVRSATFQTGTVPGSNGVVSDVINYEQVGLTLKFKPLVFPNQDVQVAMSIESKDVSGASTLTPTFTERTITGTARVQNNKTLLLASVAQAVDTKGRSGLPLLGMIPIIGRLFTAPTRDNRQVDIVIAVTPRVIRAPAILPEDEAERQTGSLAVPTNNSLEAMVIEDEENDRLAEARRVPNTTAVQLPDKPLDQAPGYVKSDNVASNDTSTAVSSNADIGSPVVKPIESSVKTLQLNQTADTSAAAKQADKQPGATSEKAASPDGGALLSLGGVPDMVPGDR